MKEVISTYGTINGQKIGEIVAAREIPEITRTIDMKDFGHFMEYPGKFSRSKRRQIAQRIHEEDQLNIEL